MTIEVSSSASQAFTRSSSPFAWPRNISPSERKSLIAGGLGWMLDAMDVMLYSFVLAYLMTEFGMSKATGGLLNSLTLAASAIGGFLFGILADRIGRTRALMASILVYSMASAACGFSHSVVQLAIFRAVLGLGMGGEWSTGAALIAETWRAEHRGKALGLMQSTYAIGEAVAAITVLIVFPHFGWRAVFFVGVLPALLVLWIYRGVPEPELWKNRPREKKAGVLRKLLQKDVLRNGLLATTMNACGMFGYWGLFTWIPSYLSLPVSKGGRGFSLAVGTTFYLVLSPGKWLGYASFGFFADAFGRRKPYFTYLLVAAILVPLYGIIRNSLLLMLLGPFVAFFGTGFFSGYAAIASELFPGEIRAAAMGLSYNLGRGLSAAAPFAVGAMATQFGFLPAFFLLAGAFLAAAFLALLLPETRGRELT
ncbi:MAG TPA: MFS transporter [Candidatus Angelobacter sp.]|nr:MFS transporter [Candidatus Angelobacter sp.]